MSDLEVNLKTHSPKLNPKMNTEMYVYKRDGRKEPVHFEKVQNRIKNKSFGLNVNPTLIAQKVCSRIYDGVKTSELDELACQLCASLSTEHPDYGILANRIIISNNHKTTPSTFREAMLKLYDNQDTNGNHNPLISEEIKTLVLEKGDEIEKEIDYQRDYFYDYFGFKTLQRAYLLKSKGHVVERIQHLIMRVSLGLHGRNLKSAFQSYHLMSQKFFTHATPTLFHAGTPRSQCLSCFLIGTDDSVNGMYKTVGDCAQISKWAGGIGVHVSNIRSKGSYIRGSNGESSGLIPLLRVYNATARHIDQAGKRKGSIAIYLETHHPDIFDFLDIRKNNGNEEARARDLFTALWVSDLFMKKVEYALKHPNETIEWCLFDPDECPGLTEAYGDEFEKLYEKYEKEGRERQKIDITKLWKKILSSQIETGTPYILYKDQINKHCNQKNIGTIKSSNLCVDGSTEILTKEGFTEIKTLENKKVEIWNGFEFSNVLVKKTGQNQDMQKVIFNNGEELICTPYHKFYIKNLGEIPASELKENMEIIDFSFPKINEEVIKRKSGIFGFNKTKLEFVKSIFEKEKTGILIGETNYLIDIKKIINSLGFHSQITNNTLILPKEIKDYGQPPLEPIKIKEIIPHFKTADTYCFNEEKRHYGVFNRILTGQCAEITEFSNKDEYACCCLSSISLSSLVEIPKIEGKVKIYTKTDCPYCEMACELLGDYEKIVLDDDEERKAFYNDLSGVKCEDGVCKMEKPKTVNGKRINTVPQIFINDEHVGGYTELKAYLKPKFNFEKLEEICYVLVKNLNRVIDINFYPVPETARGNFKHRPLGIGVQGLADTLMKMRIPFESDEAKELNKKIFESIQYYCLKGSMELSRERQEIMESNHFRNFRQHIFYELELIKHHTKRKLEELEDLDLSRWEYHGEYFTLRELLSDKSYYSTFEGSPLSQGIFQFESMGIEVEETFLKTKWNILRRNILKYGIRNSLLTALMPTASTSQILGNNECFEPITSNIYSRRTLAGDFVIVNQYLVNDLIERGIWSKEVKDMIIANNGSIQNMSFMTRQEKELYKTVWEIKQKALIDLSADRTPFICQTQSLNLFFEEPKNNSLGSALLYGWKRGLKTGSYYIRSRPKIQAQQFTIDPKLMNQVCESCSG